jgi:hypothetical protein
VVSTNQSLSIRSKMMRSLIDIGGATTLEPHNFNGPPPPLPSECSIFPYLPRPSQQQHKHKPLLISQDNLLVYEREVLLVTGTYHSTSTKIYHLSIAHLVNKHKYFYNKDNIRKGTTMQHITISSKNPTRSAQYITCIE